MEDVELRTGVLDVELPTDEEDDDSTELVERTVELTDADEDDAITEDEVDSSELVERTLELGDADEEDEISELVGTELDPLELFEDDVRRLLDDAFVLLDDPELNFEDVEETLELVDDPVLTGLVEEVESFVPVKVSSCIFTLG